MKHGNECREILEMAKILSPKQRDAALELARFCRERDGVRLSYPSEPGEAECHYLLWRVSEQGQERELASVLAFIPFDDTTAECVAFTYPKYRNRGYFSRLLARALDGHEDTDVCFPVSGGCEDTLAALEALGAEFESREYQMELRIAAGNGNLNETEEQDHFSPPVSSAVFREEAAFAFYISEDERHAVGSLRLFPVAEKRVCLHHVEIALQLRGRGLGQRMLRRLAADLARCGGSTIVLQVSEDNGAAVRVYEKVGFQVVESLSYYFY